jgi:hypothetical protein
MITAAGGPKPKGAGPGAIRARRAFEIPWRSGCRSSRQRLSQRPAAPRADEQLSVLITRRSHATTGTTGGLRTSSKVRIAAMPTRSSKCQSAIWGYAPRQLCWSCVAAASTAFSALALSAQASCSDSVRQLPSVGRTGCRRHGTESHRMGHRKDAMANRCPC